MGLSLGPRGLVLHTGILGPFWAQALEPGLLGNESQPRAKDQSVWTWNSE